MTRKLKQKLEVSIRHPHGIARTKEFTPKFDEETLRGILATAMAQKMFSMPDDSALKLLAIKLNQLHLETRNKTLYDQPTAKAMADAKASIPILLTALENRRNDLAANVRAYAEFVKYAADADQSKLTEWKCLLRLRLEALNAGHRVLRDLRTIEGSDAWFPSTIEILPEVTWHAFLPQLVEIIRQTIKPSNPKLGFGTTRGLLDHILVALIPKISGESPVMATIFGRRTGRDS